MATPNTQNPFHAGELEAHARAGVGDVASWAGGFIRDYLPEQHRAFHTSVPFLVIAGSDAEGKTWVTLVESTNSTTISKDSAIFTHSPDPQHLALNTQLDPSNPLAASFEAGCDIGVLGIELATRRRNRFSGHVTPSAQGYSIAISQSFGNCPQYIRPREWRREAITLPIKPETFNALSDKQIRQIQLADTMFMGSGQHRSTNPAANGYDASHRGGEAGFVSVISDTQLQIPDYAGNNFFNTIGNLLVEPSVGLLFIDFESGDLLHISGRASIDWAPDTPENSEIKRIITVDIHTVLERPKATALRWTKQQDSSLNLSFVARERESDDVTSFYFTSTDGNALPPFEAGQHLPIELQIPGQIGISKRSYSLSGSPSDLSTYRLSVKRDEQGLVSRFLHDSLSLGSIIKAQQPSGGFVNPCRHCPLVLVSAGIGLTPMLSILHNLDSNEQKAWYVHGARNGLTHALRDEVDQLIARNDNMQKRIYYSQPTTTDTLSNAYDAKGRISASDLIDLQAGSDAHYLICGPSRFISELTHDLEAAGIDSSHIHFETFGAAS
ncbi:ferredoxin [Leucothrix sargassi]|nr:ferredoxin [Leucothrix sargassi]